MTISDLIAAATARLTEAGVSFGHGTTNAHDEAAWLVLWSLQLPLDSDDTRSEATLAEPSVAKAMALIEQRITTRKPAAYLTGEAWLQGVPFTVDERVIVPRSLIAECLAEASIDPWLSDATHGVLDLCTGNGSLAVLAAMAWPEVDVVAADLSADALAVARLNVERHQLQDRIRLVQGDGLSAVTGQVFDLILCNPPYVNSQSMAALPPEYQAEPPLALAGGSDGMDFIRRLLRELPAHLSAEGLLVLEIGHEKPFFEAAFPHLAPVWLSTSAGDDQVLLLTREALRALPAAPLS